MSLFYVFTCPAFEAFKWNHAGVPFTPMFGIEKIGAGKLAIPAPVDFEAQFFGLRVVKNPLLCFPKAVALRQFF